MKATASDTCAFCGHRRDRHSSGGMCAGEDGGSECYCVRFPDAPDFAASGAQMGASEGWEALAHHFADQLVEWWHIFEPVALATPPTLATFMGLTEKEHLAWVECRFADLASAVASRVSNSHPRGPQ